MKIFSIVGSTAVGKTSFALELAEEILKNKNYTGIDLISADSRQVYQGLEIISGADVPADFKLTTAKELSYPFFSQGEINLYGVSIISPDSEWSITHFQNLAWEVIEIARKKNRLVMVVGGTGLYHHQLSNSAAALRVKPDEEIRQKAAQMELTELQLWAKEANPTRFKQLNNSDMNNPRRLIRVIEVGQRQEKENYDENMMDDFEQIYLGLSQDLEKITTKIKLRVAARFAGEAIQEIVQLQKKYHDWSLPAFSALGVSELSQYLNGLFSKEECLSLWTLHELQYAKRQLTWWKKLSVTWFEIDESEWKPRAFTYILNLC